MIIRPSLLVTPLATSGPEDYMISGPVESAPYEGRWAWQFYEAGVNLDVNPLFTTALAPYDMYGNGTFSRVQIEGDTYALKVVRIPTSINGQGHTGFQTTLQDVDASTDYIWTCDVRITAPDDDPRPIEVRVQYFRNLIINAGEYILLSTTIPSNEWVRLSIPFTSPSNVHHMRRWIYMTKDAPVATGDAFEFTRTQLEEGTYPTPLMTLKGIGYHLRRGLFGSEIVRDAASRSYLMTEIGSGEAMTFLARLRHHYSGEDTDETVIATDNGIEVGRTIDGHPFFRLGDDYCEFPDTVADEQDYAMAVVHDGENLTMTLRIGATYYTHTVPATEPVPEVIASIRLGNLGEDREDHGNVDIEGVMVLDQALTFAQITYLLSPSLRWEPEINLPLLTAVRRTLQGVTPLEGGHDE